MAAAEPSLGGDADKLYQLLARVDELCNKTRFEAAAAKAQEAVALVRTTTEPTSLLRACALLQHAECLVAQRGQVFERMNTGNRRTTYAAEEALCATAYASLVEALPILTARGEANTLLPGKLPPEEEEFQARLVAAGETDADPEGDHSPAALAAATADARKRRRGQWLGYRCFLQAAAISLCALYPAIFNTPFPSLATDGVNAGRQDINVLMNCVINGVVWMGASAAPDASTAPPGVQWRLGGFHTCLEEHKLDYMVNQVLNPTLVDEQGREHPNFMLAGQQLDSPFRRTLDQLWNSPRLAARRRLSSVAKTAFTGVFNAATERGNAEVARLGLARCGNGECGRVESSPKAFKKCSRCLSATYCSPECQKAAWQGHRKECKLLTAAREANAAST